MRPLAVEQPDVEPEDGRQEHGLIGASGWPAPSATAASASARRRTARRRPSRRRETGRSDSRRVAVDHECGRRDEEQRGPQRMRREAARQRPHGQRGHQREHDVGGVERHFADVAQGGQQQRPGSRRSSADANGRACPTRSPRNTSWKCVGCSGLDLSVLGVGQVVHVVALDGLVEKGQPQQQDERHDEQQLQSARFAGRRWQVSIGAPAGARRSLRPRGWCASDAALIQHQSADRSRLLWRWRSWRR